MINNTTINSEVQKERNLSGGANSRKIEESDVNLYATSIILDNRENVNLKENKETTTKGEFKEDFRNNEFKDANERFEYIMKYKFHLVDKVLREREFYPSEEIRREIENDVRVAIWEYAKRDEDEQGYLLDGKGKRIEKLLGYADTRIRFAVMDSLKKLLGGQKVSQSDREILAKIRKYRRNNFADEEIIAILDLNQEKFDNYLLIMEGPLSLDNNLSDNNNYTYLEKIGSMDEGYEEVEIFDLIDGLANCKGFDETDVYIVKNIYVHEKTGKKIASELGISESAVSQRLKKPYLAKLRELYLEAHGIRGEYHE